MKTVIIGSSPNPDRYAYQAAELLRRHGHEFVPMGIRLGQVLGEPIRDIRTQPTLDNVHTITLYLRPELQVQFYDYLIGLNPKRFIFNPGTENPEFINLCEVAGIETVEGCTLVMLRTGQF